MSKLVLLLVAILVVSWTPVNAQGVKGLRSAPDDNNTIHKPSKKDLVAGGVIEKGLKCMGGATKTSKGKKCEGGAKMKFGKKTKTPDIVDSIVEEVGANLQSLDVHVDMDAMQVMEEEMMLGSDELDMEKTIEVGGFAKLYWGCNVTFVKKRGKMGKKASCGFKSVEGMGGKPADMDEEYNEFVAVEDGYDEDDEYWYTETN